MMSNSNTTDLALLASAINRLKQLSLHECFDASNLDSRPNAKQQEILNDIGRVQFRWVIAGNQCKPSYSLVKLSDGTLKPIGEIQEGDWVMAYDKKSGTQVPALVTKKWQNGIRSVYRYYTKDGHTDSTPNHQMPTFTHLGITKRPIGECDNLLGFEEEWEDFLTLWKIKKVEYLGEFPVYDITIAHPDHIYICDGYLTGNSGKSSLAAREIAWILNENHPTWTRPPEWGTEPLLIIVAGQDRKLMELEMWGKKIKPFLNEEDWKEARVGSALQYCENRKTKDKIVFISHNDSSDTARKHMQGYVAHYVWLDEMPSSINILEELQRRVDARRGYFMATFTPKFRNDAIRKVIESAKEPVAKIYRMSKLDNPLYADRRQQEIDKLDGYPESYKNAILYGDWYVGDNAVYFFDEETMVAEPPGYHPSWRHAEGSDPALQSKFGFTLWAEDPKTGIWYCVRADYISGILVPEKVLDEVLRRTEGLNMCRRISDPHEAWYINTASARGISYITPFDKNSRKGELIKGLQDALGTRIKIAPWCTTLIEELRSCQWSETSPNRIVNASSYHCLDASQYFVDCIPKYDPSLEPKSWYQQLKDAHKERLKKESLTKKLGGVKVRPRFTIRGNRWTRLR